MKTSILLSTLALLATSSALPAEIHDRGLPFAFPTFPSFPAFTGLPGLPGLGARPTTTSPAAKIPSTTAAAVSTTKAPTPTTTTASTPNTGSGSGFGGVTGGSTEDGVKNGECKELTVIFARGTSETGNVGTVSGPPMFSALRSALGNDKVTVQGVDYPASAAGNANMGADGGPTMASLVQQALSQCPSTKIALSGYSQGGMVVHNAIGRAGAPASSIAAVVVFGDPMNGEGIDGIPSSHLQEFCADGDSVCDGSGGFAITQAHLTYGNDAQQAADFIINTCGLS